MPANFFSTNNISYIAHLKPWCSLILRDVELPVAYASLTQRSEADVIQVIGQVTLRVTCPALMCDA